MDSNPDCFASGPIQITGLRDKRKAHLLSPRKGKDRPQNVIFVDTETQPKQIIDGKNLHQLRLGVARFYRTTRGERLKFQRECVFYDAGDFARFVNRCTRPKTVTYLVAHNLKFDSIILRLYDQFPLYGWDMRSFYYKGTTSILKWTNEDKKLIGLDNGNFFTGKLEKLGEMVSLPKLSVDFNNISDEELTIYCRRDVEIMYRLWCVWLDFLDAHDCGKFVFTVSATAFNCFRHRFMDYKIYIDNHPQASHLEKLSYHGGRTEARWIGYQDNDSYYHMDVNSMYPYVMSQNRYPTSFYGFKVTDNLAKLESRLTNNAVTAYVEINTDEPVYPLAWEGRLVFPIGQFVTTLSTPEIVYALEHNHIKRLYCFAYYKQQPIFSTYARYWYDLRHEYMALGNDAFNRICKLMGNGLYGKFAQAGIHQSIIGQTSLAHIEHMTVHEWPPKPAYTLTALAGNVYRTETTDFGYNAFPGIAAHVTAYARMYLWRLMKTAGLRNVFYVDTDCLIVNQQGFDNLLPYWNEDKLGSLKVEKQSSWLRVHAAKDYEYEGVTRCKGIRASAIKIDDNTFVQDRFYGIQAMIAENRLDGVFITPVTKHLSRVIRSGYPGPDGWVSPLVFSFDSVYPVPTGV